MLSRLPSKMTSVTICLLRNDLRYLDNQVLQWAHQNSDRVLPLYCFDPRHYGQTYHHGFPKTGVHRLKFLLESLKDLKSILQGHGSDLLVKYGKPEEVIPRIVNELGGQNVKAVVFQEEVTQEETDVEQNVALVCETQKFWGSTLYHKQDLPFQCEKLPDIFTQFRQAVDGRCHIRPLVDMPPRLKPPPEGVQFVSIPSIESFNMQDCPTDARTSFPYAGGQTSALERLKTYFWDTNCVASYKLTRNKLAGANFSTKFSPWLAMGCISPRQIYWELKRYEQNVTANDSTYWVIFELMWRDYFKFVGVKYGNKLFYPSGINGKNVTWVQSEEKFKGWQEGKTGVPFVDANMRELMATGFMSNRGRQNVASFLTKDLKLDWRLGAEWFESLLIDHDVCSNYGNWLYTAGLGNDPRENRKFNMIKQAMDYDANGEYVKLWIPELSQIDGASVHTPWCLTAAQLRRCGVELGETYPKPLVVAPEWGKFTQRKRQASGKKNVPQQRGMDFYFKSSHNQR